MTPPRSASRPPLARIRAAALALALGGSCLPAADLKTAAAEPNLVKRSRLALANGERAVLAAGDACRTGDHDRCNDLLAETRESVELAKNSLDKTGLSPNRSPRHFKDAEIRTRKILRLLDAARSYVHPDDQQLYDSVRAGISGVNDQLLAGVMGRKKKK